MFSTKLGFAIVRVRVLLNFKTTGKGSGVSGVSSYIYSLHDSFCTASRKYIDDDPPNIIKIKPWPLINCLLYYY